MKKLLLITLLALSPGANADCFLKTATADIISTDLAVANGAVEANPLGVGGVIFAKAGVYYLAKYSKPETKGAIYDVACPVMAGATTNNLLLAAGVGSNLALPLGVITGTLHLMGAEFGPVPSIYNDDPNSP